MNMVSKIFHKGKYYMSFKRGYEEVKKDIYILIEKLYENDTLRITLSDDEEPLFLFRISVTRCDYEDLKKQQELLIDFDNFPSQIVRLLQQCAANNMFIIIHQLNPIQYNFEIVEHNEFRRLVHLSLNTTPATDSEVKQHMAETILFLKKNLSAAKSSAANSDELYSEKLLKMEEKIRNLTHTVTKLEEDKLKRETELYEALKFEKDRMTQEKLQWQKDSEMNTKTLQASFQESLNKKDKQIEELNILCKQLRDNIVQLENNLSERSQRVNVLENEVQKTHIEVATLKAKNVTLDRENTEKEKQITQIQSTCAYLEKVVKDKSETVRELNEALLIVKKEKESLEKRLSLSESLANKNNEAAHSTAEQLLKANQIISKQNNDLIEIKEKLLCRTAIALEQEKVIEKSTQEIVDLKSEIESLKQNMSSLKNDLDILKKKCESSDEVLKDRDETIKNNNMVIQWLHKKMEDQLPNFDKHKFNIQHQNSSTPYFVSKSKSTNQTQESEESIDFYASSKSSNLEDSSQPQPQVDHNHIGLDPKYLQPSHDDNQEKNSKGTGRMTVSSNIQKGKENKNIELPKVNYREKKSTRGTYRATPVSAYFP